ncbi:type II toxin-antitoxin system HicA family toxin [Cuspidothrix issatschenkoi]|nr:type II toxin-antitoxin system HicA family toxin [Cuspidothrix issatschenkoi]
MTKVPSLPYTKIIAALERDGWVVVRQRGSKAWLSAIVFPVPCYS